jgi:transcriptional regulator with XRE-family HTH domain
MKASELIRTTRQSIGLTQAQLSERSGIAVPNISAIEAGKREPRFDTVQALLGGLGVRLLPFERGLSTVFEVSVYMHEYLREGDLAGCFRQWLQLANELNSVDAAGRILLSYQAPTSTGSAEWDSALAALVEHRLNNVGAPSPTWLSNPKYVLAEPTSLRISEKIHYPLDAEDAAPEFRNRNILYPVESLVSF